mgnify:CR=1 FL=1
MQKPQKKFETPYNVDAEVQVIGCIMVDGMEAMRKISHILTPEDFYEDRNKWIFKAVVDIYRNGVEPDLITISDHMKNSGYLDLVGGYAGLSEMTNELVSVARVVHYAKIVSKYAVARRLLQAAREIGELTQDVSDVSELVEKAEAKLKGVTREARDADEKLEVVDLQPYMTMAREHREPEGTIKGLSTGLQKIDKMTQGFVPGELMIISGQTSHGKQERVSEVIPTPSGDRRFGEIKPGDYVFGSNGKPTMVNAVFPQGVMDIWRVNFSDGSYLDTGSEHLWTIRRKNRRDRVLSSRELAEKIPGDGYYIPLVEPIEYDDDKEPVPAYEFGMYLADGSCYNKQVHITKSPGLVSDYLKQIDSELIRYDHPSTCGYLRANSKSKIGKYIYSSGLVNVRSRDKFIPNEWFNKSVRIRTELLTGLLDGDGTFNKIVIYQTTSERLADDVVRLVTSLGAIGRKSVVKHNKGNYWAVRISGLRGNPFRFSMNHGRWKSPGNNARKHRFVKSVEIVGREEAMCISVDAPDQLYVGDTRFNIVTHNTQLSNNIMLNAALNGHKVMFVTMEMTKQETADRFNLLTNDQDIGDGKIFLNMRSDLAYTDVTKLIEKAKERGCELVVIDHLHYFSRSIENATQEVSKIVKEFKSAAIKYELPIILICHVRKMEPKKHPTIDDLRDSSLIAQDADLVLIVWRDQRPEAVAPNEVEVVLWKNRNRQKKHRRDFLYADGMKLVEQDPTPADDKERRRHAANAARMTGDKEMADVDLGGFGEADIDLPEEWK